MLIALLSCLALAVPVSPGRGLVLVGAGGSGFPWGWVWSGTVPTGNLDASYAVSRTLSVAAGAGVGYGPVAPGLTRRFRENNDLGAIDDPTWRGRVVAGLRFHPPYVVTEKDAVWGEVGAISVVPLHGGPPRFGIEGSAGMLFAVSGPLVLGARFEYALLVEPEARLGVRLSDQSWVLLGLVL